MIPLGRPAARPGCHPPAVPAKVVIIVIA